MPKKSQPVRNREDDELPEHSVQHSRLVAGVLKHLYTDAELKAFWNSFWKLSSETGRGKGSLASIIRESLGVDPATFDSASAEQRAEWCLQIHNHPEIGNLFGYAFRQLNPVESSRADELLKEARVSTFVQFANAFGMEHKEALFYLVAAGFGWLMLGGQKLQSILTEGLEANGIHDTRRR